MRTSRAPWLVLGTLAAILSGGLLTAISAAANRNGATDATSESLIDTILCGFGLAGAPPGFRAETASAQARMHRAMEDVPHTGDPDRDFALGMIPHHQGAIDMALIQIKYGRDKRLRRLAQTLIVEQSQEIAYLKAILNDPHAGGPPDRLAGR